MRIRSTLASSLALFLALALAPQAHALPDNEVHYTVYYSCHVGPGGCGPGGDWYGCLVGEWTLDCSGHWFGWGMRPYTNCAEIVDAETGESCGDLWPQWQSLTSASCQSLAVGGQKQTLPGEFFSPASKIWTGTPPGSSRNRTSDPLH
jgi:hypothetical protein